MPDITPERTPDPIAEPGAHGPGLRLRLWFGCLGGALVAAAGIWWVIGTHTRPDPTIDMPVLVSWLAGVAGLGVLVGAALALWLDHGILAHLRGLSESLRTGQVARLRGLPASAGWGELSDLTQAVQRAIGQQRQMARASEELASVREQVGQLRTSLDRWAASERWNALADSSGPVAPVAEALDRGLRRMDEVRDQNLDVVRQITAELGRALEDARESAEQAERGFVEATSLLTTVRELQRLEGELRLRLDAPHVEPEPSEADEMVAAFLDAARQAIDELVRGSSESVDHLAHSVTRVEEVADQVRVLSNRSTLIALNAAVVTSSGGIAGVELAREMKQLALEVQEATTRTSRLSADIEREAASAMAAMRDMRERVAERLERIPAVQPPASAPSPRDNDDASRLLERMREMIQDAAQKSERLSATGERVSRATDRLVRGLEEENGELNGLAVRLTSPGDAPEGDLATPGAEVEAGPHEPHPMGLRLLGQERIVSDDAPGDAGIGDFNQERS